MTTPTLAPRRARGALGWLKGEWIIERLLFLCAALSVLTTAGIIAVLAFETYEFLLEVPLLDFLTGTEWTPLFFNRQFGVLPLVAGTMLVSAIAMIVAIPMGLLAARSEGRR